MTIRHALRSDLNALIEIECACFPPEEAASAVSIEMRLNSFANHFWLMCEGETPVAFVDGFVTDLKDLSDEMFERAEMHAENGAWQMLFGVATLPAYQGRGCATALIERVIADARAQKRSGLVLTCKQSLIPFYSRFGFANEGESASAHGGAEWYQMRLTL